MFANHAGKDFLDQISFAFDKGFRSIEDNGMMGRTPEMQKKIADLGLIPMDPPSLPETRAYLASERTKWGALVRKLGLEGTQ